MIYSIFGFGKGKTEASIGLTVRTVANGERVLFAQFMKDGTSLEISYFNTHHPNQVDLLIAGIVKITLPENIENKDKEVAKIIADSVDRYIDDGDYQVVVLDEVLPAVDLGLLDFSVLKSLVAKCKEKNIDLCMTGRIRNHELRKKVINLSTISSNIFCEKHIFNTHCPVCNQDFKYYYTYCPHCGTELKRSRPAKRGRDY